jgi:glycine/D-amino acid oxidase-like deaminating enzyme
VEACSPLQIVVVGAGIAGCTVAFELSRRGFGVTLLDRASPGLEGASGGPVALLNPHRGRSGRSSPEDLAGLEAFWKMCADLEKEGLNHGATQSGVLRIAHNARQAKTWQRLSSVRWLEPPNVPRLYHAPHGGFLVNDGGWLEPAKLLAALVTAATAYGACTLFDREVETISGAPGTFLVGTSQGPLQADRVVICTGAGKVLSPEIPQLELVAGDLIGLVPTPNLPLPIAGAVYGASLEDTTYVGGNHRPGGTNDPYASEALRNSFSWFVPKLKAANGVSRWTGVRARRPNNTPLLAELRPGLWFLGALAGRGFLVSARLAGKLASHLSSDPKQENLELK